MRLVRHVVGVHTVEIYTFHFGLRESSLQQMRNFLNKGVPASPNGYRSSRVRNTGTPVITLLVLLGHDGYVDLKIPHRLQQEVLHRLAVVEVQLGNSYFFWFTTFFLTTVCIGVSVRK